MTPDDSLDLVPRKSFDQLQVGDFFPLPPRTVTDAHFSAFQALSGDNHPIHYDIEYCRELGHQGLLAHGLQVLCFTAAGAGLFPHVLGEALLGFIEQSSRFLGPVYPGDTLRPKLEITELVRQKTTGVVTLGVAVHNQHGKLVLDGWQKYLMRLEAGGAAGATPPSAPA